MSWGAIGVFGVGMIGGSIGLRARRNGAYVLGYDYDVAVLAGAQAVGAIDAGATLQELVQRADAIVLAAHLGSTLEALGYLRSEPEVRATLIADVASVKTPIVIAARGLKNFVATHPLAGSERNGFVAARADLFDGRFWAYAPSGNRQLDTRAAEFIAWLGAVPAAVSAEEHDRVVGLTSHLPQLVGACYAQLLRERESDAERFCGPVATELLRISGMSFDIWRDVLFANAQNVGPGLRSLSAELLAAADALAAGDADGLKRLFPGLQGS
jgi:prephenate dehydrogenase